MTRQHERLVTSLNAAVARRLLHAGANTADLITQVLPPTPPPSSLYSPIRALDADSGFARRLARAHVAWARQAVAAARTAAGAELSRVSLNELSFRSLRETSSAFAR